MSCMLWPILSGLVCALLGGLLGRYLSRQESESISSELSSTKLELTGLRSAQQSRYADLEARVKEAEEGKVSIESDFNSYRVRSNKMIADRDSEIKNLESRFKSNDRDHLNLKAQLAKSNELIKQQPTRSTKKSLSQLEKEAEVVRSLRSQVKSLKKDLVAANKSKSTRKPVAKKKIAKKPAPKKAVNKKLTTRKVAAKKPSTKKATVKKVAVKKSTTGRKVRGRIKSDDLTKVKGIGPKIKSLLNKNGIKTYAQLASASKKKLNQILDSGGKRYNTHSPNDWPLQASFLQKKKNS